LYGIYFLFTQGDIAYNLQEWRFEEPKKGEKEKETASFNVGDRFMDIIEDVAAYVPYMVRLILIMRDKPFHHRGPLFFGNNYVMNEAIDVILLLDSFDKS
jgi:hypothetical protein